MTDQSKPRNGPLEGLRILDFTRVLAGPLATMILADLGAEVIKIEDIEGSDITRHNHPFVNGESHYFLSLNRNKQGISLNLKDDNARKIALDLARHADVVVENFRPGVMERLGLGHGAMSAANPRLIYCSMSAFGQTGPWSNKTAYDLVIQALTGAMAITGEEGRPPVKMGLPLADEMAGLFAAIGILGAVERRERTGLGGLLDVGMFDVGISLLSYIANIYFATGKSSPPLGSAHPTIYPYNAFKTADGYIVVAPFTQAFWRKFCKVVDRPELPNDARFKTFSDRIQHRAILEPLLNGLMLSRTSAEWLAALEEGDVPNGPVNSVAEALEMEQTIVRGMVVQVEHPRAGPLRTLGTPFRFDYEGQRRFEPGFAPAPLLGEHTAQVLSARLGYSTDKVATLEAAGVIRTEGQTKPRSGDEAISKESLPQSKPVSGNDEAPLKGFRVLDLTRMFAGPFGALILADFGAEVIKIEEPQVGDPTRRNIPFVGEESSYFMAVNRAKQSVTLDLKNPQGRQALLDLVAKSDILIENYRPGVMDRLGLSYEALREANPHIIVCAISGFGQTGPMRSKISFDLVNQAMAGTMAVTGEVGRPPVRIGLPVGDLGGGIFGALAILAAVRARRRTGQGSYIDLGLHDVLVSLLGYMAQCYFITGETPLPVGSGHHHVVPYRAYEASDGFFVLAALSQDFWVKFARSIGHEELVGDPRFATLYDRKMNRDQLDGIIEPIFRERTVADWVAHFLASDVPAAPVASVGEALECEQAVARASVFEVNHPTSGTVRSVGTPVWADGKPWRNVDPSPTLGQHNAHVLCGLLGYSAERLAKLRADGVVG